MFTVGFRERAQYLSVVAYIQVSMDSEQLMNCVRSGEFVAQYIEPRDGSSLSSAAVQPNGVDLSIGELYELDGRSYISNDDYTKAERTEVETRNGEYFVNPTDAYVIVYDEQITIPENHIGLVLPRSRMMRCGLEVNTAVWDSGYSGIGEGQLSVNQPADLVEDLRVAQMVFFPTEELDEHYDGTHQGERIE